MNKHLIIFFGQYRNFDSIAPQLNLDEFDVIASTWNMKYSGERGGAAGNWRGPITEDDILKFIPHAKVKVWDYEFSEMMFKFRNTANMLFHFKAALDMMDITKLYQSITLHRFDLFSNIHKIHSMELGDGLYCDTTGEVEMNLHQNQLRIQDWLFFGKQHTIQKYIREFEYSDIQDSEAHYVQGNHLIKNKIERVPISGTGINYTLCKDFDGLGCSTYFDKLNSIGLKYFDLKEDSDLYKSFKDNITKTW